MLASALAAFALLPGVLTPTVAEVKPKTPLPILLPDSMPTDARQLYPSGVGGKRSYSIGLAYAADCGGANACFAADFSAEKGGTPFGRGKVTLARGRHGRYQPLGCGASCSPPSISWSERGVTYSIQAKVVGTGTDRQLLTRMANEAIRRGPR
jgi:hypothetical protein